jgi:aryl-alcohol dehydrogenase-like predicted oxidoreductase
MQRRSEDFTSGLHEGRAEPQETAAYFAETRKSCTDYIDECWFEKHSASGLTLSRLGYGAYRSQSGNRAHFDALREAILLGTNVVDTAANYADGESEQLAGDVIRQLIEVKRLKRQQVVVVTKIGYIQGRNLELLRKVPIPDNVQIKDDLWHCIHPDFLKAQIQLSRYRLGLKTIDFLLLHNPEEYLLDAERRSIPGQEAQAEFLRRLKAAFEALEFLVERGVIQKYGISSNTLAAAADDYSACPLDEILPLAGPNFQAVQFPGNLLETDFRYNRSASGGTLAQTALSAGLWTMSNRPFNAAGPHGLVRLARMVEEPPDGGDSIIAEFLHMQGRLTELEVRVREELYDFDFDREHPSFSYVLEKARDEFASREHLRNTLPDLLVPLEKTIRRMQTRAVTERGENGVRAVCADGQRCLPPLDSLRGSPDAPANGGTGRKPLTSVSRRPAPGRKIGAVALGRQGARHRFMRDALPALRPAAVPGLCPSPSSRGRRPQHSDGGLPGTGQILIAPVGRQGTSIYAHQTAGRARKALQRWTGPVQGPEIPRSKGEVRRRTEMRGRRRTVSALH